MTQVNKTIENLIQGNNEGLSAAGAAQAVPDTIAALFARNRHQDIDTLLGRLVAALHEEDEPVRQNSATALASSLSFLVEFRQWQRLDRLLPAIRQILRIVEDGSKAWPPVLKAVILLAAHHIAHSRFDSARTALMTVIGPSIDASANEHFRNSIGQAVDALASEKTMATLLDQHLHGRENREEAGRLLTSFGGKGAEFLLQSLTRSESKAERLALLKLIKEIGVPAEQALLEMLEQDSPWYVTRNIIRLLGESGNQDYLNKITCFLGHEDVRVQQEVLTAAAYIGGRDGKAFLLQSLNGAPRQRAVQIVSLLGNIGDRSQVTPLIQLLERSFLFTNKQSIELQTAICTALGKIGSVKALPLLQKIIAGNTIPGAYAEDLQQNMVLQAADKAVQQIESGGRQKIRPTRLRKALGILLDNDQVSMREAAVLRKAMAGKHDEALAGLTDLIVSCARKKDFDNAVRLQERLFEIDPMALTTFIRTSEIIEQEKTGSPVQGYLDTWSDLLGKLSTAEFSAIYHELENLFLQPEALLVRQGEQNDALYFINHGSLKVYYRQDGREFFLNNLNSGEIAGENFLQASVWTVSLSALTETSISILSRSNFNRWQEEFPGLEDKLRAFSKRTLSVHDLPAETGLNRRQNQRYRLCREVHAQMTSQSWEPIGREFQGELYDISRGGLSIIIRIAQPGNGRLLLGRRMRTTIPVGGDPPHLHILGEVLAVHPMADETNNLLLHLAFHDRFGRDSLQTILG